MPTAAGLSIHAWLDRLAAATPAGADGLVLLPYVLGEKTPLHDPHARGTLIGLGLHHRLAHVWRAALEGVAFGFRHHVDVFRERGADMRRIVACDGGAASDLWLQICADVLTGRSSACAVIPAPAWARPMWRAWASACSGIGRASPAMSPAGRSRPTRRVAVYDRAYAVFRETYERLKTLYPRLAATAGG